jgi:hypothetical protein
MPHIITFKTSLFDLRKEPRNSINPIWGTSALVWLKAALAPRVHLTDPDEEDWGWYSMGTLEGREYLIGANAFGKPSDPPPLEWLIQIHKQRSLKEKLLGRNRMGSDDPMSSLIRDTLRGEPAFQEVELRIEG